MKINLAKDLFENVLRPVQRFGSEEEPLVVLVLTGDAGACKVVVDALGISKSTVIKPLFMSFSRLSIIFTLYFLSLANSINF